MVEWARPNGGQEVEAITIKKLVIEGEAGVRVAVQMQYRGEIWKGQILSLHGNETTSCLLWGSPGFKLLIQVGYLHILDVQRFSFQVIL